MLNRSRSNFSYFPQFIYALLAVLCLSPVAGATSYFVDCNGGNDGNPGTSQSAAWKTLAPVNARTFAPGDSISFIAGCSWTGTLHPGGSGANGNTITIDQYGTGALPHIDGGGATEAVLLSGQQYWDINNLDVSNMAATAGTRRGVRVIATGVTHHIHLVGLNVHNISGELGTTATQKSTGGIGFESTGGAGSSFDDVLIENCTISHADDVGLYLSADSGTAPRSGNWAQAKWNNVVIRGNHLNDIGKNAMIIRATDAALIENNVINGSSTRLHGNAIYTIGTLNVVMQFNEVYNTALTGFSGLEDTAFDPDNDSVGTIIQYNYSHNNAGGLANPNMIPGAGNYCDGTIIRYNISQDDVHGVVQFSGAATNTQIYNNTIYVGAGLSSDVFGAHLWGGTGGWANNTTYSNNIIYNAGTATYSLGGSTNNVFTANLFFGNHSASEPADSKKITTNPLLVNPGSGGTGISTLGGYHLQPGSPAAGSGVVISNNGGLDFFGTTLPSGAPSRGAAESGSSPTCAVPPAPVNLAAAAVSSSQINLSWNAVTANCPVTYCVFRGGNQIACGLTGTSFSDTGLLASTTYSYFVEAVDSAGSSAPSNQASATTTQSGCGAPPSVPASLAATAASSSQINLTWTASTAGSGCSITYNVFQSTTNGFTPSSSNQIASGVTSTSFSNTGLLASTPYYYLVEAADSAGSSGPSNQANATTLPITGGPCSSICIDSGSTTGVSPFVADADFSGGATINHANTINTSKVTNPAPAAVYQTARVATATVRSFTYTIPGFTAGSSHTVRLHLCETFFTTAGSRTFNVTINGTQVLTGFDIVKAAGGQNIANIQQFMENANSSGQFVITFTSVVNNALISGIEID